MTWLINRHLFSVFMSIAAFTVISASSVESAEISNAPVFALPIKCNLGADCYIMHYVDLDPGREPVDYGCGRQTYSNHNGTDFGIADLESMKHGVPVMAAAPGVVLRVRDGVPDQMIADQTQRAGVDKIECGNGIVVDHGNGWQTQYCHLLKGSLAVKQGGKVDKGTVIGMVGASGLASFPHVHFTVRHLGKVVDPFVGETNVAGCDVRRQPLWEKPPDYVPTGLIRAGFSSEPPAQAALWRGEFAETKADSANLPAVIFWVHVFGVLEGDREHFTLIDPAMRIVIDTEKPLTKNNRSWVSYMGKKNTVDRPLSKGEWRGSYQLKRGARTLINLERAFLVE
jgi:murein DD-endopeptidase